MIDTKRFFYYDGILYDMTQGTDNEHEPIAIGAVYRSPYHDQYVGYMYVDGRTHTFPTHQEAYEWVIETYLNTV